MVRTAIVGGALFVALSSTLVAPTPSGATAAAGCAGTAPSDFNGDGVSDVAIGEPSNGGGAVHVLYGTRSGLAAEASATTPDDLLLTSSLPLADFGDSVLALDLNGDGCSDLVVGAPSSKSPHLNSPPSGIVEIYLGSPSGLNPTAFEFLNGTVSGHTIASEDEFGLSLAAADFNHDGKQDLIVGAPGEGDKHLGGAVYVFAGLFTGAPVHRYVEGQHGIPAGTPGQATGFGDDFAVGDFNADGTDDLAIGETFRTVSNRPFAGAVVVINGSANPADPLSSTGVELWSQDSPGISGTAENGDFFGDALAAGDFNGDHRTDLAIGVPEETVGSGSKAAGAGQVNVIYSAGTNGLTSTGNQAWTQNSSGISGTSEFEDRFGASLASGDFNGDDRADLAIGVPTEGVGSADAAGAVNILMGSASGLSSSGQQLWNQSSTGVAGTPETDDAFGSSLAVGRIRSAAHDDLIIGVPGEGIGTIEGAGQIQLLPSSSGGLTATGSQVFSADTGGVQGAAVKNGRFGFALS